MRDELTKQWKRSKSYAQQINQMPTILAQKELQIDNALLMGLDTISPFTKGSWELNEDYEIDELLGHGGSERRGVRGMAKLVACECWLEILRKLGKQEICSLEHTDLHIAGKEFDIPNMKVYVQEYFFDDVEARFLQALGYTVLDHVTRAQALHNITKTTFLMSVGVGSIEELSNLRVVPALIVMSPASLQAIT
ncbi:hypothetical protein CJF30_00007643 [Rutstroemia sp. NJR-2017a BBW]|nr:hypothetical protein CJF30_00007643 [Rutstroemia sp. NJR-2017a BBW]